MAEQPIPQNSIENRVYIGPAKTGDNIDAKRAAMYGYYPSGSTWTRIQTDANGVVQTSGSGGGGGNVNITEVGGSAITIGQGTITNSLPVTLAVDSSDYYPGYNAINKGGLPLQTDEYGNLNTRGAVTTDEGTHRSNFTGSAVGWSLSGVTFTNGSSTVSIASGFTTNDLHYLDFIKLGTDAESAWGQISFINSDTQLTLANNYTGTGGTGAASISGVATSTGSGATISVASGALTIAAGTTSSSQSYIYNAVSDGYNTYQTTLSVSQRIANQDIYIGFESNVTSTIKSFSRFHFTGTTNTQVITETGWNPTTTPAVAETETNTITLPSSALTSASNIYRIDQRYDNVLFYINDVLVAQHRTRLPHVYDMGNNGYQGVIRVLNGTSPASGTSIVVNTLYTKNYDSIDVYQTNQGTAANSQVVTPGQANAAVQTWTEGSKVVESMDLSGNQRETLGTLIAGENLSTNRLQVEQTSNYAYISTATTTVVKSGSGFLHTLTVQGGTAGTIIIYDNTSAAVPIMLSFDSTASYETYEVDVSFATGLTVVTSAATKITVAYR